MIWMISTYSPSSSSSATVWATSRSKCPSTRPKVCHRCRSEEHTSELQSLMRISYAVFCLKKKTKTTQMHCTNSTHTRESQYTTKNNMSIQQITEQKTQT